MLISKFDLYKSEWLELVFDDRNKQYGAYELRQHYGRTMVRAMLIAFISVISVVLIVGFLIKPAVVKAAAVFKSIPVHLYNIKPPVVIPPKAIPQTKASVALPPTSPTAVHKFVPLVVTIDTKAIIDPPKTKDLESGAIGPIESRGPTSSTPTNYSPPAGPASNGTETVTDFKFLEVMPVPYGGASAWSKFLSKNLRYPDMAIDQHIQGKVWVSFIIEADGKLSNFKVERGVGYGLDEEALRVLKLAPAWKPGIQNGHPVRVQYNIPINFQLTDEQ
ncbi:energy transducer TonB [Mucilaginibacter sp.]